MNVRMKIFRITCLALVYISINYKSYARDYFNPALLEGIGAEKYESDLTTFENGSQIPGTYYVDIVLNGKVVDHGDVEFGYLDSTNKVKLTPCISIEQLRKWNVKTDLYSQLNTSTNSCVNMSAIQDASVEFDFDSQRLNLSIPQIAIVNNSRGYVSQDKWDNGINAAILNYSLYGSRSKSNLNNNEDSYFGNLRPGLNIGPWRLRNYMTWSKGNDSNKLTSVYTYLQRPIVNLKSQLVFGDSSSSSDVFDSISFRGLQLSSDEDMLPESTRGYAPVVRGIARTNAQITIKQNGYQIYQQSVSPGAFEINDMYPTGGAGDLFVTVKEADGSEQKFIVPFASLPVLKREGQLQYSVTAGNYRSYDKTVQKKALGQLSLSYGLSHGMTAYGGIQSSAKYTALSTGLGQNMGDFGAISVDLTQAKSTLPDGIESTGQSWRSRYNKNFTNTGTNFAIAGYRYSTGGYYGMQEILDATGHSGMSRDRRRNRAELSMNQSLGQSYGVLSISALREDYWESGKTLQSSSIGYNNNWNTISYGLIYTRSKNSNIAYSGNASMHDKNESLSMNISMPLGGSSKNTRLSYSAATSNNNDTTHNIGISGSALDDNNLNWSIQQGLSGTSENYNGSLNASYKGSSGEISSGYDYDKNTNRINYGIQGGIIAHSDGVTLTQVLGETNALIKASGARNVGVSNQPGVLTDWRGYAVVPSIQSYKENIIGLKTDTFPENVEFDLTSVTVVPTRGAIVRATYAPEIGDRALIKLITRSGKSVPFGAVLSVNNYKKSFIVGDDGQVFVTGLSRGSTLHAKWGASLDKQCKTDYMLDENDSLSIKNLTLKCL
ncbi:fimbria/pilus outer membrane usher protein [Enterobacter sp. ENT02]|uniref:fimbria/pilus outer membrane usher protein n=1 Tax=Enterobacter sp. ENT02 TaxID=2854767 RepID=UPI001C4500C7|nr:fimbria/pilus outer membrane usher protein [Enterobacter sp. ENT02]MBV7559734.1 fimbrial biogenesis outer membrane usher protein [Enterobacter sp. ENT02]